MNDKLAQITSIITFANDYLINNRLSKDFLKKRCFDNCESVSFIDHNKIDIADNPVEWFKYLKAEGCRKVRTHYVHTENNSIRPDYFTEGIFGGGGIWRFESMYADHVKYWTATWYYDYPYPRSQKYYHVVYRQQFKKHQIAEYNYEVEKAKKQLGSALWNISEFANKQGYEKWFEFFNKAIDNLYSSNPAENCYFNDIIPFENFNLSEQQLIYSANKAWCFGQENGAWNTLDFKDRSSTEIYLKLTAQLHDEIINSILTITNKTCG